MKNLADKLKKWAVAGVLGVALLLALGLLAAVVAGVAVLASFLALAFLVVVKGG